MSFKTLNFIYFITIDTQVLQLILLSLVGTRVSARGSLYIIIHYSYFLKNKILNKWHSLKKNIKKQKTTHPEKTFNSNYVCALKKLILITFVHCASLFFILIKSLDLLRKSELYSNTLLYFIHQSTPINIIWFNTHSY